MTPPSAPPPPDALSTELIHHPYQPPGGFEAVMPPVHKASTVLFQDVAHMRRRDWRHKQGYTYGLQGTPTSYALEARIATLEGGRDCLLLPSGLAAITLVNLALLGQGDEVLIPDNVYGPSKELARHELAAWGIAHRLYDPMLGEGLADVISERTRLVWLEAPGSVTMEFPDLAGLVRAARRRGVPTALDNTWGAGLALRAFELPEGLAADISVQALTKYPSGGADVLMGSVTTVDPALHQRLKGTHMRLGFGVGANDVELVLRSLPTMALRYRAQDTAARGLADWLAGRPQVRRVLHPALPGAPGHEHWRRTCHGAAGLFSILLQPHYTPAQVDAFVDGLRLFRIGYSWGGPQSLAVPYDLPAMRSTVPPDMAGHLVRLAIGLESVDDLQSDLLQSLEKAFGAS